MLLPFPRAMLRPLSIFKEERKQNKQKIPRVSVPRVSFESMTGMGKTTGLDLASPRYVQRFASAGAWHIFDMAYI
jgi:hypothetical protein